MQLFFIQEEKQAEALLSLQIKAAISSNFTILRDHRSGILLILNAVGHRSLPIFFASIWCIINSITITHKTPQLSCLPSPYITLWLPGRFWNRQDLAEPFLTSLLYVSHWLFSLILDFFIHSPVHRSAPLCANDFTPVFSCDYGEKSISISLTSAPLI